MTACDPYFPKGAIWLPKMQRLAVDTRSTVAALAAKLLASSPQYVGCPLAAFVEPISNFWLQKGPAVHSLYMPNKNNTAGCSPTPQARHALDNEISKS